MNYINVFSNPIRFVNIELKSSERIYILQTDSRAG